MNRFRILQAAHNRAAFLSYCLAILLALSLALTGGSGALADDTRQPGETHLLVVAVCPPGIDEMDPVLCHKTADRTKESFTKGFALKPQNTSVLVDEAAAGANVMDRLEDYAARLSQDDRLIIVLNTHGGRFEIWSRALVPDPAIRTIAGGGLPADAYTMQFWSEGPMGLPATALNNQDLVAFDDIIAAIGRIDAHVGLIVDSCYAGLAQKALTGSQRPASLDLLVVSSGEHQLSNLNADQTISLFIDALASAVEEGAPTFGEAIAKAADETVARSDALCRDLDVTAEMFAALLPDEPVPASTREDNSVNLPDWFCVQVPSMTNFSGVIAELPVA